MKHEPDWISAKDMREWLNISDETEFRWRQSFNLHMSTIGKKVFYDRNQIKKIITENSTYALLKTA